LTLSTSKKLGSKNVKVPSLTSHFIDWTCPLITPKIKGFPSGFPINKIFPERHLNPKNVIAESLHVPHMWVIPSLSFASGNSFGSVLNLSSTPKLISKLIKNF